MLKSFRLLALLKPKKTGKKEKIKLPRTPYSKITLKTLIQDIKSQKNPHLLIGAIIFLILLVPLIFLITKNPKTSQAAWFNDSWMYRKEAPITYTGSENLTEYQVLIDGLDTATLITNSKLQSDCDDLRFTATNGELLDYFIVPKTCNTSDTKIWVKTSSINAGDSNVLVYYGNPGAQSFQDEMRTFTYQEEKTLAYILHSAVDDLEIISLSDGNSISHNSTTVTLDKYDTDTGTGFGGGAISQYGAITAKGPFNADDDSDDTDSIVPVSWAGTEFEFYSRDAAENLYLYAIAPWQQATITVYSNGVAVTGCTSVTVTTTGSSYTCASVSNNIRIESDVPVLLFTQPTNADDQMPLKPNSSHPWIGSGSTSRTTNGATSLNYSYYYNTSASEVTGTLTVNTGLVITGPTSYGTGAFLFETTNSVNSFGITQYGDGDGGDGHMHADITEQGTVFGSANQADYISIASTQAATCSVYEASDDSLVGSGTATSSNTEIYFLGLGTGNSDVYTTAGWYMECDVPVSAHFQDEIAAEENLLSTVMARQFTYPTPSVGALGSEELSPGPTAHWKLDEKYGSTANDSTQNNNDATITGAEWQDKEMCVSGGCLYFNGVDDDYALTTDSVTIPSAYTLSTWFKGEKTNQIVEDIYLLGFNSRIGLKLQNSAQAGKSGILIRNAADDGYDWVYTSVDLLDNQWHNLTATVDTSTLAVNIYIDGKLKLSDTITDHYSGSRQLIFGSWSSTYGHFTGFMDEPKIYPYARTAEQIKTDYLNQNSVHGVSSYFGPDYSYLSDGLVGFWKMDESSGNATDSSGNNNTLTNVNTTTYTGGKYGNGADYEKGSSQYHYVTDNAELSITGDLTISSWIKPESATASNLYDIAGKWDTWTDASYLLSQYGDEIRVYIDSSSNYETTDSTNLSIGTWYHVTASYNSTTQTVNIFVNGELQASTTTGTIPSSIGDDAGRFHIGAQNSATTATNFYDGIVDNVMLHNRTLSPREIQGLYNFAPSPVGYWKLDDKTTGSTVNDFSTYGNTLTHKSNNYFGDGSDGDVTISVDTSLTNTQDGDYVIKEYESLTIDATKTLTTQNRGKGLFIYVKGDATINGTLSMTARGAYVNPTTAGVSSTGLRLPMLKSGSTDTLSAADFAGAGTSIQTAVSHQLGIAGDGKIYTIVRTGGTGGTYPGNDSNGNPGGTMTNGTGGGGSGAERFFRDNHAGSGAAGTCFSGGSGGGGKNDTSGNAGDGTANGGPGGNANGTYGAGGGAGNPGGTGVNGGASGETGTGGVVWLVVSGNLTVGASGAIQANGKNGGASEAGGGATGGGIVRVLYGGTLSNNGTIQASGGNGGVGIKSGGDGGVGSAITEQIIKTTTTNIPQTAWINGKLGNALDFENESFTATDPSDFDFTAANSFTLEAWAKTSGNTSSMYLITKADSTNGGYKLYQDSSGNYCFAIDDDSSWTPDDSTCTSGTDYGDDEWHHVTAIKNGTSSISIYVDGIYANSDVSIAATGTLVNTSDFYVGVDSDEITGTWTGGIDDIKVYNYARTPGQIVEDMNGGHPLGGSPLVSQVAYWKFDEGYGTTTNDSGYGTNNGTITGADWTNDGKFGKALDFVAETDRVDFSTDYSELTTELTVSAWVQPHSVTIPDAQGRSIATTYDWDATPANYRGWNLGNFGSSDYLGIRAYDISGNITSAIKNGFYSENLNTWAHVAGVFKGSEYLRLYINGILVAEDTSSIPSAIAYNGTNNLRIGSRSDSTSQGEWDGYIDEVKLYSAALTPDQILIDMNQGKSAAMGLLSTTSSGVPSSSDDRSYCPPGDTTASCSPVGHWKLDDENTGSTVNDSSTNGNHLTHKNGNYFGDGSDGDVTISANTSLTNTADGDYVIKQYNSLTINAATTLTTQNRGKGLFIYVKGNATINGIISMTAKGASVDPVTAGVSSTGLRLPLLKSGSTDTLSDADFAGAGSAIQTMVAKQPGINSNGKIYQIPRTGATGAAGGSPAGVGTNGSAGSGGQTGGGAEAACGSDVAGTTSGGGGDGTAFSGGAGGGAGCGGAGTNNGTDGSDIGGYGGDGAAYYCAAGGGAGNLGGTAECYSCIAPEFADDGEAGTGGVVWLVVGGNLTIGAGGKIEANGKNGGDAGNDRGGGGNGGGGSGGGSVFVLYVGTLSNSGTVEAAGGTGGVGTGWGLNGFGYDGGDGGTGYVEGPTQIGGATSTTNIPQTAWINGKVGNALSIVDESFAATDPSDFDFTAANSFTLEAWAKTSGDTSSMYLITKADSTNGGYKLYQDSSGNYCFAIDDDSSWTPDDSTCTSGTDYGDDEWHHVTAIKNGTTSISIYVDGIYANSDVSIAATGTLVNTGNFHIGVNSNGTTDTWTGEVDDIKVYNYARTMGQIAWDYNHGQPVGWWKLDECQGTTAYDSSGFTNNGTITIGPTGTQTTLGTCTTSGAWYNGASGKQNGSLNFDGTDDYAYIPNDTILNFGSNGFSVSYWMNFNPGSTQQRWSLSKGTPYLSSGAGWAIANWTTGDPITPQLFVSDGTGGANHIVNFKSMYRGFWHQLTFVVNRDDDLVKTFFDGVFANNLNISALGSFDNTNSLTMGSYGASNYSDAKIDDVRVYNYALTAQQIKALYNFASVVNFSL